MVRETGIEPARLAALDPKSSASASSATPACIKSAITQHPEIFSSEKQPLDVISRTRHKNITINHNHPSSIFSLRLLFFYK